ncbi:ribosome small subunit-dependent GTPase A [Nocardioides panacisoli]|uniref:ribosome small subunit-dependent GTPase A n=1 Tax=Nocardioides panacisoli TaxID=627624 RepID=UPI001C62D0D3|nr:ribosome small subunit-dependent GTPase A [Nocardioides panacisoli]QYJ03815.1 ribosome small subunit-dependent GTPase A [Nocardioides panacisoli]
MDALEAIGLDAGIRAELAAYDGRPARVVRTDRGRVTALVSDGTVRAGVPAGAPTPVTGDWVAVAGDPPVVVGSAERRGALTRPRPHGDRAEASPEQVLAANVDLVALVTPVDTAPNLRRVERGVVMAYESGATPLVLATKTDLAADLAGTMATLEEACVGVEVLATSAVTGAGIDTLAAHLATGRTAVLLGASGVGKSTLVNALLQADVMATREVRGDHKGRHTTTHRELLVVPGGGAVIDTPGLRSLTLGGDDTGRDLAFPDVAELAEQCHFHDCRHDTEPGCAVQQAVADGGLAADRFEGWRRIRAANENAVLRADPAAHRRESKRLGRMYREAQAAARYKSRHGRR